MNTDRINQLAARHLPGATLLAPVHEFARAIAADIDEEHTRSTRKTVGAIAVVIAGLLVYATMCTMQMQASQDALSAKHAELNAMQQRKAQELDIDEQCVGWMYNRSFIDARNRMCKGLPR